MDAKTAYAKGYAASRRTVSGDVDGAQARFVAKYGGLYADVWLAGWDDYACGNGNRVAEWADEVRTDADARALATEAEAERAIAYAYATGATEADPRTVPVAWEAGATDAVGHSARVAFARNNHGYPWHAVCNCGHVSRGYAAEHAAEAMADEHETAEIARTAIAERAAIDGTTEAEAEARIAAAMAYGDRIRERAEAERRDAEIADALDCAREIAAEAERATERCTVTIFGRALADLPLADADTMRGYLATNDGCPDCVTYENRVAERLAERAAERAARAEARAAEAETYAEYRQRRDADDKAWIAEHCGSNPIAVGIEGTDADGDLIAVWQPARDVNTAVADVIEGYGHLLMPGTGFLPANVYRSGDRIAFRWHGRPEADAIVGTIEAVYVRLDWHHGARTAEAVVRIKQDGMRTHHEVPAAKLDTWRIPFADAVAENESLTGAEVVYEGHACTDCTMAIANGDLSGLSDDEYEEWQARVMAVALDERMSETYGGTASVVMACPEDCEGEYRTDACSYCGTELHGDRHPIAVLATKRAVRHAQWVRELQRDAAEAHVARARDTKR